MNRLTKAQKDKVKQFVNFTSAEEANAITYLHAANWVVELGIDNYFNNPPPRQNAQNSRGTEQMFKKYADHPDDHLPGRIGPHGITRLLNDLRVDPSDRSVLVLAWKLNAATQCEFSREEWIKGLDMIKIDSIEKLATWMKNSSNVIHDPASFRQFYHFTFNYAKPLAARGLALPTAVAYWRIIFGHNQRVEDWIAYLEKQGERGVTKDEWSLFLEFLNTVNQDLSNYDSEGAWPVRIDEYVDYCKSRMDGEPMEP